MEILNYINGKWIKPSVKEHFEVINPATGMEPEVLSETIDCSRQSYVRKL
jgi:acyl-CoA reductase-like NAD-dependent aldehyde dehydrogenase